MTIDSAYATGVPSEMTERIPPIVDVDAHVVEPPELWSSRLPSRYREVGPRIEYLPPGHPKLDGGSYIESPGTDGDPVAWWHYEDHLYSVKRLIAAAGYPAEEITMTGITFDDMRPGCWQVAARLEDMTLNGVEAQLSFPNYPRFCGQLFLRGQDRELALPVRPGVQRLDGGGVGRRIRRSTDTALPHPPVGPSTGS